MMTIAVLVWGAATLGVLYLTRLYWQEGMRYLAVWMVAWSLVLVGAWLWP